MTTAVTTPETPTALVRKVDGWHLIQYGIWSVSVDPDGQLQLPRHLHPRDWQQFAAAMAAAVDIAAEVIRENEAKPATAAPPDVRIPSRQQRAASISRPKRRGSARTVTATSSRVPSAPVRQAARGR